MSIMAPHGFIPYATTAQGPLGLLFSKVAHKLPLTHAGLKLANSSPMGPYRGTDLENLEVAPGTSVIG